MRRFDGLTFALILACVFALAACGGGGNGNGYGYGDPDDVPLEASDVDRESAILQTGGSPPIVSAGQARSQQITVRDQGDLYYEYFKGVNEDGIVDNHGPYFRDCSSVTCTNTFFHRYEDTFFTPIMTKDGIPLARSRRDLTTGDGTYTKYLGYGGWMDHSMFAVTIWGYRRHYEGEYWFGGAGVSGEAFGNASKSNPSVGPFQWNGVMVGRNSNIDSNLVSNVVQGDATVSAELSRAGAMSIDVEFFNVQDLNSGSSVANMRWNDVPVVDGSFEGAKIHGSFYGPQHEEVAGAFERNYVLGAFGARRGDGEQRPSVEPSENQEMTALPGVPANHGIAPASEITIRPGNTERLGNVDVFCPVSGPSCVFSVAGDGTVAYQATGGRPEVVAATAVLTDVPANHGIAPANEITIRPGSTERLGNVDVFCPAGGPSCVVGVAGDGTVAYQATGGMPTVVAATAVLTDVPADHGIAPTDEVTIQPGSTERLGNVDLSCPFGGPSCIVSVAVDGTLAYRQTGGMPTIVTVSVMWPLSPVVGSVPDRDTLVDIVYDYHGSSTVTNSRYHHWERSDFDNPSNLSAVLNYDWSYWADPDMHSEIIKLQKRIKFEDKPPEFNQVDQAIYGILDYAVFWVADEGDLEIYPATTVDRGSDFGAGVYYSYDPHPMNNPDAFDLDVARRPDVYIVGASWRGDALGIGKEQRDFVTGRAVVRIDEVDRRSPDNPASAWVAALDIDINYNNGYSISMKAAGSQGQFGGFSAPTDLLCDGGITTTNCTFHANPYDLPEPYDGEIYRVLGHFLGPNGEEVVGDFETENYFGAFGAKRSP